MLKNPGTLYYSVVDGLRVSWKGGVSYVYNYPPLLLQKHPEYCVCLCVSVRRRSFLISPKLLGLIEWNLLSDMLTQVWGGMRGL